MSRTSIQYYPLGGGLDVVTPALSVPPGRLIGCVNFEPHYNDGYRRIDGYERFDGRPRPHLQTFIGFDLVDATGLTTGTVVTGDTSGATGTVIGISGNAIGVTKVTGTFQNGEDLNTGAYTIDSLPVEREAPDQDTEDTFLLAAHDEYRDDIAVVPGSGEVRGVWRLRADTYAVRNNAGATAGVMHKASASGWTTTGVTLAHYLKFDAGGGGAARDLPVEGDTITGGSSSATATVHRVINWAGGTATNDATGYLILTGVSGGPFTNNEKIQVGGTDRADANGASAQFAFSIDGEYRFHNHNFAGSTNTFRTYAVNGVDDAFEIDENGVISPILIPTTADLIGFDPDTDGEPPPSADKPFLIEEHRNYLFLAFPGGRVVHSVVGQPLNFSGFLDAAEFGVGDEVTGLNSVVGSVLVITTERETQGLYGKDTTDWEKRLLGERTGGRLYSTQKLDTVYAIDDLGITSVARTDTFGDFMGATVSQLVQPIINSLRDNLTWSSIVRKLNQVRWYFDDNTCLIMFVPQPGAVNEARGTATALKVQFGLASYPIAIKRVYNIDDELEEERTFFASTDGYVYEDLVGTNFDGANIQSYARTAFSHLGSPARRKFFRRVDVEMSADSSLDMQIGFDLTYGAPEVSSGLTSITTTDVPVIDVFATGGFWDNDEWDTFNWDGQSVATARANLSGTGENIGFLFFNDSPHVAPFILQGLTVHYDSRRLQR
jgi:hypothetical protein